MPLNVRFKIFYLHLVKSLNMKKICFFLFVLCINLSFSQADIFDISRSGSVNDAIALYTKNPKCINLTNDNGHTPLILPSYHGNEELVAFLIDKVKDVNDNSDYGTPLMAAVVKGNTAIVEMLLKKHADTNIADANGTTALHYAVMFKNYDLVKLLLEAKADATLKDNRDKSALDYAMIYNDKKLTNLLNDQL